MVLLVALEALAEAGVRQQAAVLVIMELQILAEAAAVLQVQLQEAPLLAVMAVREL
jgi:hypothetical protein